MDEWIFSINFSLQQKHVSGVCYALRIGHMYYNNIKKNIVFLQDIWNGKTIQIEVVVNNVIEIYKIVCLVWFESYLFKSTILIDIHVISSQYVMERFHT